MSANTTPREWRIGEAARHPTFGLGRIAAMAGRNIEVDFRDHGRKQLLFWSVDRFLTPSDEPTPWPDHPRRTYEPTQPKPRQPPANSNNALEVINPATWEGKPVPGREWFIEGLIPSRTVTLLYGDGGLGKSLLALQIGAASALGMQVVGLDPMPGRVLYVAAEDEEAEFHRRLATIVETCGRSLADVGEDLRLVPLADRDAVLMTPDRSGRLAETPLLGQLRKLIFDWRPALVVLDTLADLFGGDEIKRAQVRQFVGSLRAIAIEFDCAILLLAHPSVAGMRDGTGSSGSTAWNNSVRSRLYLTSAEGDTDARVLRTVKANYGPVGGEVKLRWLDGIFVADDGHTGDAAARLVDNVIDKAMLASLRKLQQQGRKVSPNRSPTYAPKVVRTTPECQAFSLPDLEASMHRLLDRELIKVIKDGPPSRQSARLWVP